jgi:cell division transport system ATP-binding protein
VCQDVSVRFDDGTVAVDGLSLTVDRGAFVGVSGASGAGKSTFLRLLIAEVEPSSGAVRLGDRDPSTWSRADRLAWRRSVGFASQELAMLEDRTVRDNVAYALRIRRGTVWSDAQVGADRILRRLGVAGKGGDLPSELSGGERQRSVLAQAIIGDPALVVADEPTANIDPANSRLVIGLLAELHARGSTVVVSTHHDRLLMGVATCRLAFDRGRLLAPVGDRRW